MKRRLSIAVLIAVIGVCLIMVVPVFAAQNATLLNIAFNAATCTLDVTFQVEDAGPYFVTIYDDGILLAGAGGTFPAGSTQTVRFTIGGPDGSPGVAVAVRDSLLSPAAYTFVNNEFWTDPEGITCQGLGYTFGGTVLTAAAETCLSSISSGAVQGRMLETVQAVYEPRSDATTNVTIPGGTSWWIAGAANGYYKLFISCPGNFVWVPASTMGPNYDPPFNGAPLPDASGGTATD